jgi:hypothetical protein
MDRLRQQTPLVSGRGEEAMVLAAAVVQVSTLLTEQPLVAPEVQAPQELLFLPGTNNLVTIVPGRKPPFGGFFCLLGIKP